ncbi:MAG: cobyric acid synthase [Marinifilaceae bacterium]|nr:cobyric acid synthase [Marinifilaceae bacterium]
MKILKPIMFVGTCSDAGKSVINAGFCRIFKQDGYSPAPYKAQNMSLNSYSTPEGLEIGRAQAVQAEACGVPCHTDMNPVLLKPTNDISSQVVLNGKPIGNQTAKEYFLSNNKKELFNQAYEAFERLSKRYSPIVIEGAGSISEINLRARDIVNMPMAVRTGASTYLIADIDKGGVFGSVYGSVLLLTPEERKRLKGIIINKFRGDIALFEEGKKILEELTGVPVVGVIPYFHDIEIEEEDSVVLDEKTKYASENKINVAVVLLRKMSNFTDFRVLEIDDRFHLYYTNNIKELEKADIIILPGSKNTISDLLEIKNNGVAKAVIQAFKNNKKVIGICGGYQMLGTCIEDPNHIEGNVSITPGLGLLPQKTIIGEEKVTEQRKFSYKGGEMINSGYEIHMGETINNESSKDSPLCILDNGIKDGYYLNDNCWGSYLHGILDNTEVINDLAKDFDKEEKVFDYQAFKEEQYDKLAQHIRENIDLEYIYSTLK